MKVESVGNSSHDGFDANNRDEDDSDFGGGAAKNMSHSSTSNINREATGSRILQNNSPDIQMTNIKGATNYSTKRPQPTLVTDTSAVNDT